MKMSPDKMSYLSDKITRALHSEKSLRIDAPREEIYRQVALTLKHDAQREADIEEKVRRKIESIKRRIQEDTPEWSTLFRQYYEEEVFKIHAVRKTWQ
ncbi:MAG: DUF507 family protein [Acidobacteriota bacterium]|nr:MAG: DUF507 family protein [Acidobacteriota bacterium]